MASRRRRHTPEQIIRKLREADRLLGEGHEVAVVAKQLEVSEQTLHRWRAQYGGLKAADAKRLKQLEKENQKLKRIVADQLLENQALKASIDSSRANFAAHEARATANEACSAFSRNTMRIERADERPVAGSSTR